MHCTMLCKVKACACFAVMCVMPHARPCLSTGWALNHCFAWTFGTTAVHAQGGGGYFLKHELPSPKMGGGVQTHPKANPVVGVGWGAKMVYCRIIILKDNIIVR